MWIINLITYGTIYILPFVVFNSCEQRGSHSLCRCHITTLLLWTKRVHWGPRLLRQSLLFSLPSQTQHLCLKTLSLSRFNSRSLKMKVCFGHGTFFVLLVLLHLLISVIYFNVESSLGEILSIYVGNLAPSTQIADMEHVFKAFGRLKLNGIAIRSKKVYILTEI